MSNRCRCGLSMQKVVVTTIEIPDMQMHGADEPIYGDARGHYWYEGEKPKFVDKIMLRCAAEHLTEVHDAI